MLWILHAIEFNFQKSWAIVLDVYPHTVQIKLQVFPSMPRFGFSILRLSSAVVSCYCNTMTSWSVSSLKIGWASPVYTWIKKCAVSLRGNCSAKTRDTMISARLEPRLLDPESSTPTIRPPQLPHLKKCWKKISASKFFVKYSKRWRGKL